MTFIRHLSEHVSGDLEEIDIRTIAVKNTEVHTALEGMDLPAEVSGVRPLALFVVHELADVIAIIVNWLVTVTCDDFSFSRTPTSTVPPSWRRCSRRSAPL